MSYEMFNAQIVLDKVEELIEIQNGKKIRIDDVCDELSIFDWWKDYLTTANLKDMRSFLRTAVENGFTGYVCFKVGATGCANGMWAYKEESQNGYSPDGDVMYKSFTPAYTNWNVKVDGEWLDKDGFDTKSEMMGKLKGGEKK